MAMPKMPCPAAMSSTLIGPAAATPRMSAIACAGIIIIDIIERAKFSHSGFSSATVLSLFGNRAAADGVCEAVEMADESGDGQELDGPALVRRRPLVRKNAVSGVNW